MKKYKVAFFKKETVKFILSAAVLLAIVVSAAILSSRLKEAGGNTYVIKNKYYGFEVRTPNNWFAEEKIVYSEENIADLLQKCENSGEETTSNYEIGRFRLKSQKYPQNFDSEAFSSLSLSSGMILEISVNCPTSFANNKDVEYGYGDLEVGGEKAIIGFSEHPVAGRTKHMSFFHEGFQYTISEYVYISPEDKRANESKLAAEYDKISGEIISTFKFLK